MTIPVSVIIITYNEEASIGRCLDSLLWCDEVVVVDSHSTDETRNIAESRGARIVLRKFDNYANQRNFALEKLEYRHAWVFMLDADEVVTEELVSEIKLALSQCDNKVTLFRLRRKDYFMGTWLKYSTNYASLWLGRLMRRGRVWIERSINEEYKTDGVIKNLKAALIHYPFSSGISAWIEKHNRYSTMEAELIVNRNGRAWHLRQILDRDPVARRKALKAIVYGMPGRALLMFFGRYFASGGFLDGRAGLMFCLLKTHYEYLIDCKVKELHRRSQNLPV